ncbi:PepSY domain-containing protein [Sphingomonas sp. LR55]
MLCVTGLPLIFEEEIDGWLNPPAPMATLPANTPSLSLDTILARAAKAAPASSRSTSASTKSARSSTSPPAPPPTRRLQRCISSPSTRARERRCRPTSPA